MKDVDPDYQAQEELTVRKPLEFYHFWHGSNHWYYTSADSDLTVDGQLYHATAIMRGSISYDSTMETTNLDITMARVVTPTTIFIAQNPVDAVNVDVFRLFRDLMTYSKRMVIFSGQIESATIQGPSAVYKCAGLEHYLKSTVPRFRYQPTCNHRLFDSKCGLLETGVFAPVSGVLTYSEDGYIIQADEFIPSGTILKWGWLEYQGYKRMIVEHAGQLIVLRYAIPGLEVGVTVTAHAGCDGLISTCNDPFGNLSNFFGFPYIPWSNPAAWNDSQNI